MGSRVKGERDASRCRRRSGSLLLAAAISALSAAPAQAAFHEILVREVHAGGAANSSYVVLQAYSSGQNFVGGHALTAYNASGTAIGTFKFSGSVSNGQNQMTILVADSAYAAAFPSGPIPDGTAASFDLDPTGGAVCWAGLDCVAWGAFTGTTSPPSGSPASPAGIPPGMALRRSIAAGCSTLLEFGDDTDSSATDFPSVTPNPRSNASTIVETACPSLPNTTIGTKPASPRKATGASFTFTASPASGATFECKLDSAPGFTSCSSPQAYSGLSEGFHKFEVRAVNSAGADPSPAKHEWRVDLTPPVATILSEPEDPSPGNAASFTYNSNESGSTFECSLAPSGEPDGFSACPSGGKSYPDAQHPAPFADGSWTFKVRATDQAGNEGAADEFSWQVDNSLTDTSPPDTTIVARPPDPSGSPMAFFTYVANEAGSSFQCSLDGAGFAPCPPGGLQLSGLQSGPHGFQVRAVDPSGNIDPTPAGYSWQIVLPTPAVPTAPAPVFPGAAPVPPQTTITAKPGATTRDRTPTLRFRSDKAGSTFQCKLDRGPYKPCRSPLTLKRLTPGSHAFSVRARAAGLLDPTPARARFKILRVASSSPPGRGRI